VRAHNLFSGNKCGGGVKWRSGDQIEGSGLPGPEFQNRIMCILRHGGGKMLVLLATGLGAFATASALAAPDAMLSPDFSSKTTNDAPLFTLRSVVVNTRALPGISNESIELPPNVDNLIFTYAPNTGALSAPLRFRCQLDGYEQGWHERTTIMRMVIRFIDANQRDIAEQIFEVRGESPGWTGSFTDSPWVRRKEVLTIPAEADQFWVVISSAGPPEAVGGFAIRNLVVFTSDDDTNGFRMIPPVKRGPSRAAEEREVSPTGWGRSGTRPTAARLLRWGSGDEVALALLDDHPLGHADWGTAKVQGPKLVPGQKMTFTWEEVYSIGVADYGRADYTKIPAGLYRFRMEALDLMGVPTGRSSSRLVTVPVAAWRTFWFRVAVGVALFTIAAGIWRVVESQKIKRQVRELERQRALEQERLRIAQNIHDDLGARVTEISLLSSSAQFNTNLSLDEARAQFGSLSRLTNDLVRALYETVWAVNPKNDDLDSLASFVCQLAQQMCSQAQLRCRLQIPDLHADVPVASTIRHNVIMAVKEAIHNVIKHGRASEIQIRMQEDKGVFSIEVSDNGCGFETSAMVRGNGLDNMERRLQSVRGSCSVESRPGAGTKVTLTFPLAPNLFSAN
jgi:signal transduction histidine kinase